MVSDNTAVMAVIATWAGGEADFTPAGGSEWTATFGPIASGTFSKVTGIEITPVATDAAGNEKVGEIVIVTVSPCP